MVFELVHLQDTVHITPSEFSKPLLTAIRDALAEKYPNKVVPGLGLCVTLHDILHVGESQLYPGSGSHHTVVEFRLVVFRPYIGEVMTGNVVACDQAGVRVSLGFFDEIHVPPRHLQQPSSWSDDEGVWVWDVTPDHQLFLDLDNPLRFRVEEVRYREATNVASHAARAGALRQQQQQQTSSAAPTPQRRAGQAVTPAGTAAGGSTAATPGASRPGATPTPAPPQAPAMMVIASIDRAGLGLTTWWPPDALSDEEENE